MKNVTYFFRSQGYSIERVFNTVISGVNPLFFQVNKQFVRAYRFWPIGMLLNMFYCYRNRSQHINHITGDIHYCSLLLPRRNTILTIHDIVSLDYVISSNLVKNFVKFLWYYLPLKKLKYITCISNNTKRLLVELFPWAEGKIRVIYNPVSPDYKLSKKEFNISSPTILHIGTNGNKNLERVIESLKDINCHLRIIGKLNTLQEELLKTYSIDFSIKSNLSDKEIVEEYVNCDIVSFPSLYEGFGMPIIEGQQTGRVVLTSNIEPLKEIAGDGALFVNPYDVAELSNGFKRIISDDKLRESLIYKGGKNVDRFSLQTIVLKYEELYNEILS